ncbi:replication-associated recombination protein A [Muribaculaceae bacterium]|nr:replication-associated recombination protein A [Muribaculaceae bacterium]
MDLFEYMRNTNMEKESPLAARLRPKTLEEVVGQQHIIGKDKLLYRAIKADKLSSIILYGPPGTGKTTLAKVIANTTSAEFTQINATVAGKKDMEGVVAKAKDMQGMYGRKTILFIDEIHRFNKGQQDYLLPFVEDGTLILIGATTENPYFEVNGALISRSIVFELKPLSREDIKTLLKRAVYDKDRGMGAYEAEIEEDALDFLAELSGGDARHALNAVELGIMTTQRGSDGKIHITVEVAQVSDFLLEKEYTNFLTLQQAISELTDASLITTHSIGNRTHLMITVEGKNTLSFFEDNIGETIKKEILNYLGLNEAALRNEVSVTGEYYKSTSGEYEARLAAREKNVKLIEITLSVPTRESAAAICDNWQRKNQEIYQFLVGQLF